MDQLQQYIQILEYIIKDGSIFIRQQSHISDRDEEIHGWQLKDYPVILDYLKYRLKKMKVGDRLKEMGINEGSTVIIGNLVFDLVD